MLIKTVKEGSIEDLFKELKEEYRSVEHNFHESFEDFVEDLLERVKDKHVFLTDCRMNDENSYEDYEISKICLSKLSAISNELRYGEGK